MLEYYDRKGKLISQQEWKFLTLKDKYQLVKLDKGKQDKIEVKTSWCGVRLPIYDKKPLIFITEVYLDGKELEDKRKWTATEQEALKEHELACFVTNYTPPPRREKVKK